MSGCSRLPPALWDLVIARTSTPSISLSRSPLASHPAYIAAARRYSHAFALKPPPAPTFQHIPQEHPLYPRQRHSADEKLVPFSNELPSGALPELEERVNALKEVTVTEESVVGTLAYSEEELLAVYEDLLALPPSEADSDREAVYNEEEDSEVVQGAVERLLQPVDREKDPFTGSFAQQLRLLRGLETFNTTQDGMVSTLQAEEEHAIDSTSADIPYCALVARLEQIASELESVETFVPDADDRMGDGENADVTVPVGVMSEREWIALVRFSTSMDDAETAKNVINLMKRYGSPIPEETLNSVLSVYANRGDIEHTEHFIKKYLPGTLTESQRDLHIKSYLKSSPTAPLPTKALSLLHQYENRGLPAPQRSYTRLITHMFSARSSVAHAHAWDLFSHMRYAAHPIPDALSYTMMIRACASPLFSNGIEPERALDLFHEMTVDNDIMPTAGAYSAVILACARSGRKQYVHEAFRMAKQMLDAHRDAYGRPAFLPEKRLYCALLEGAKRIRDLGRARWILAEMVKMDGEQQDFFGEEEVAGVHVDDEVMVHVFNTYAAYRPPFRRTDTVIVDSQSGETPSSSSTHPSTTETSVPPSTHESTQIEAAKDNTFAHLPPQSRTELIAEVKALFASILEDTRPTDNIEHNIDDHADNSAKRFRHVTLTPTLLNAYLSVFYAHAPLETWHELYNTLFSSLSVPKNARSYVEILERCSTSRKGHERKMALKVAEDVWAEWEVVENAWRTGDVESEYYVEGVTPRIVENASAAIIRVLSVNGHLDRALEHVKSFVQRYPPASIREPLPKLKIRSTRTTLSAPRPLVRLTSTVEIPDSTVPPLLTFPEVEVLHHKLVAAGKPEGIKYLKWVCKSYEGALRIRRDRAMRATPPKSGSDIREQDQDVDVDDDDLEV